VRARRGVELSLRLCEQFPQRRERLGEDADVGPASPLFTFEQSSLYEHFEVVADRRLRKPGRLGQMADARLGLITTGLLN
jgi:hypothetical protein